MSEREGRVKRRGERKELWKKQRRNEEGLSHPPLAFFPSLSVSPFGTGPFVRFLLCSLARSLSSGLAILRSAGRPLLARSLASFRDCCTSRTPLNSQKKRGGRTSERGNERMRMGWEKEAKTRREG